MVIRNRRLPMLLKQVLLRPHRTAYGVNAVSTITFSGAAPRLLLERRRTLNVGGDDLSCSAAVIGTAANT
jgi:hypothetical protein